MKLKRLGLMLGLLFSSFLHAAEISVFISFSMPEALLKETLKESVHLKIPAYLNGLYHDSMQETVLKIMALTEEIPTLNLQIDPTLFERFGIQQVPALVVAKENAFDVIYGHLPIKEGLSRLVRRDSLLSLTELRRILHE